MSPEDRKISRLESVIEDLIGVLAIVRLNCEAVHHGKRDRHTTGHPCPVVARICATIEAAEQEVGRE